MKDKKALILQYPSDMSASEFTHIMEVLNDATKKVKLGYNVIVIPQKFELGDVDNIMDRMEKLVNRYKETKKEKEEKKDGN